MRPKVLRVGSRGSPPPPISEQPFQSLYWRNRGLLFRSRAATSAAIFPTMSAVAT